MYSLYMLGIHMRIHICIKKTFICKNTDGKKIIYEPNNKEM